MFDLMEVAVWTCETNKHWHIDVKGSKGNVYHVVYGYRSEGPYQYGYSCSCPAFKFRGECKHIEFVRGARCGWNGELEPTAVPNYDEESRPVCPKCGGPVVAMKVAV